MTVGPRAGSLAFVVFVALVAGSRGDAPLSIHAAVTNAVADGSIVKTKQLGFSIERDAFSETNSRGGVLIGFELGLREWFGSEIPTAVRPIYRTAAGERIGKSYGSFEVKRGGIKRLVKLRARPGYAVGALRMRTGAGLDAMMLSYYRVKGDRLDPQRAYNSEWVGNLKGGSENGFDGAGMPFVGVYGNRNADRVIALGFIRVALPDPPRKAEKPAIVKPKSAEKPAENPGVAPEAAKFREKPAPAASAEKWTHRDPGRGFKVELPPGWVRMLFVEQQDLLRKSPGLFEPPEAAFRLEKAGLGDAFVLLRSRELHAGLSLDEAGRELSPSPGPYREVRGLLRDWSRNLQPGEVVVDRARHRFAWRTTTDAAQAARRSTLFVCYVGAESAVTIECHAPQALFASSLPTFAQVGDSAGFDVARAHREPARSTTWVSMAVFVGVSAVIFVPVAIYFGKKRRTERKSCKARETDDEDLPYAELLEEYPEPALAVAPSTGIVSALRSSTPLPAKVVKSPRRDEPADDPFTCVGQRTYRVYVLPDEVYFIDEGPGDFEPSGKLLGTVFREERQAQRDPRRPLGERPTADELFAMADGELNFRVKAEDVWQAQIEAPGYWDSLSEDVVGTLRIGHRTRGDLVFRFRGTTDMRRAIEHLRDAWKHRLSVHATWDKAKKKFVREG